MGREPSWKKHQDKSKLKNVLAVFITVVLFFAIANGIAKGFSLKKGLSESKWDSKSSFTVAMDTDNPSVFIYQPETKNIAVLAISGETLFETGNFEQPLEKISSSLGKDGGELTSSLSKTYGIKIDNFVNFSTSNTIDQDNAEKMFINFASITTPFKIFTSGFTDNIKFTNITRMDAFKLWWQLKSVSANSLAFLDLSEYQEEIITGENEQVLGADTASLNRIVSEYMDNLEVVKEGKNIRVENNSGYLEPSKLASLFINSVGGNVIDVVHGTKSDGKTQIVTNDEDSYSAIYLANIFDCDITEAKKMEDSEEIIVKIGSDFAKLYFE